MMGTRRPCLSSSSTMRGTAAAASSLLTVTRTSSDPARDSAAHCWTVEGTSAVSVLVMDCTTMGASEPTRTPPTTTVTVFLRGIIAMETISLSRGERGTAATTADSSAPAQSLRQVVVDDHDGEQHQEDERGLVDALFDAQADVAPHESFDEKEQDHAAIHNWDRQQVKDAEVQADPGGQFHQRRPTLLLRRVASVLCDTDRAGNHARRNLALHQLLGQFQN